MDYNFSSSLYGSDGSTVSGPSTSNVAAADSSFLDKILGVVGVGADAYAKVVAAKQSTSGNKGTATEPGKTAAPAIGVPTASGMTTQTKTLIGVGIGLVVLLLGFFALRKK